MKIYPNISSVTPQRVDKRIIKQHIRTFDKIITSTNFEKVQKWRNFVWLPLHFGLFINCLYFAIKGEQTLFYLCFAKLNYDFVPYIRNINKRKAALLSDYLKLNGVENLKDVKYGVKRYFAELGMPLYPHLHPKGIKKIIETGTASRSIETGIFYNRTDKKGLCERFQRRRKPSI